MKTIYFDESGNLGFGADNINASKYFIATFLITDDCKRVSSAVKKTFGKLRKKDKVKTGGTLHAHREIKVTRIRLLTALSESEILIALMRLNKKKFAGSKDPHGIYADVVASLLHRLYCDSILVQGDDINFVASQMDTNPYRRKRFSDIVTEAAGSANFTFEILKPSDEKGLQAVDFVSWALFRELEFGDSEYADIIRDKIVGEYEYR